MSASNHTPGPWMAGDGIDACHVYTDDGNYSVIATTDGSDFPEEVENANARLIAAAPELLVALKLIVADLPANRDWLDPAVERMARELIAKVSP